MPADHPTAPVPGTTTRETPTMLEVWDALEADYRTRKAAWEESGREGPRPAMGELPTCMTCGKPWTPYSRRPAFQPEAALRICVCRLPLPATAPVSPSSEPTREWKCQGDKPGGEVRHICGALNAAEDAVCWSCGTPSPSSVSPADPTRDTTQREEDDCAHINIRWDAELDLHHCPDCGDDFPYGAPSREEATGGEPTDSCNECGRSREYRCEHATPAAEPPAGATDGEGEPDADLSRDYDAGLYQITAARALTRLAGARHALSESETARVAAEAERETAREHLRVEYETRVRAVRERVAAEQDAESARRQLQAVQQEVEGLTRYDAFMAHRDLTGEGGGLREEWEACVEPAEDGEYVRLADVRAALAAVHPQEGASR